MTTDGGVVSGSTTSSQLEMKIKIPIKIAVTLKIFDFIILPLVVI